MLLSVELNPRVGVRARKAQEVILRAVAKTIRCGQAAEIMGISDRQMRRQHPRYEDRAATFGKPPGPEARWIKSI